MRQADLTVCFGVNHAKLAKDHLVVSNASCTTNCLAVVAQVLDSTVGIEKGFMTTIHSYTNDQPSLDQMHPDLYRSAPPPCDDPDIDGRRQGRRPRSPRAARQARRVSIRVPTPNVSVIDFKFVAKRSPRRTKSTTPCSARPNSS